jgi:ATP-binding cassette subfamily B protein
LDEASSSVNTETELRIRDTLARLVEGRTSIVIAHRLPTIPHRQNPGDAQR